MSMAAKNTATHTAIQRQAKDFLSDGCRWHFGDFCRLVEDAGNVGDISIIHIQQTLFIYVYFCFLVFFNQIISIGI